METRDMVESVLPCVVSAVRLDEVHGAVLGQEGHQLLVGPEGRRERRLSITIIATAEDQM